MRTGKKGRTFFQEKEKLRNYLDRMGLKVSQGRETVFGKVFHSHGHFTAEDLVKSCRKRRIQVSRATIYRSLREFVEARIIRKTAFGEKHEHYEHVYDEKLHHHARCIRCHVLIEFSDLQEEKIYKSALEKSGFLIIGHEMHFYGICQGCRDVKRQ